MSNFWVIEDVMLEAMLTRAHAGEKPDLLIVELHANSAVEQVEGQSDSLADAWDAGVDAANGAALSDVDIMPNPYREHTNGSGA